MVDRADDLIFSAASDGQRRSQISAIANSAEGLGVEGIKLGLTGETKSGQQVVAAFFAHLVHESEAEEVAGAGDLQHLAAITVISRFVLVDRHPVGADGDLAQVGAAQRATAR